MFKGFLQITESILALIALLMLPYCIGLNIASDEFFRNPEIIGISDYKFEVSDALGSAPVESGFSSFEINAIVGFISYTLAFLTLIYVISFVKNKASKDNGFRKQS